MTSYLLVTGDFVRTGGMDRANFALADYLSRHGQTIHLLAHRVGTELLGRENVTFLSVPKPLNSYFLGSLLLDWQGQSWARSLSETKVLVNGGNCKYYDINWVHYVHAAYKPDSKIGTLRRIQRSLYTNSYLKSERQVLQSSRIIIANSERTKTDLIEKLNILPELIEKVYYGTDSSVFYPATTAQKVDLQHKLGWVQGKPVVAFIGALGDRRKGFDTLFLAWQNLCQNSNWDADLVVIGAGAELSLWQAKAQDNGIGDRIRFLGFRHDVPDLLRASDCLVSATRYEAYGLGIHEAICCGLPAIITATAGIAERYPANLHDLLLPDADDVQDLAARLLKWRAEIDKYRDLISPFTQQLRSYSWDDMAEQIIAKI